jgi:hypothetical protein
MVLDNQVASDRRRGGRWLGRLAAMANAGLLAHLAIMDHAALW